MSEALNATSQGELVPYNQMPELELQAITEKVEIHRRHNNGITVVAYWHRTEDIVTIYVHDTRTNSAAEFPIPNNEVMDWFTHPLAHPDAILDSYEQRQNDE